MTQTAFPGTTDRRIDALLALLADNPMIVISGAKIAREIGVTRTTVWRWIEKLRALGVRVKGHPRTGYQIERVPDMLAPKMLRRRLHPAPLRKAHPPFLQDRLDQLRGHGASANAGEPHGTVVIAEEQTAGRGRAGHTWHSEKTSGIYMTVLLRPPISPQQAPLHHDGRGTGRARSHSRADRPHARPALAERSAFWPEEILRHPHRNERRAGPDSFRGRGHRHQRESRAACRRTWRRSPLRCASRPAARSPAWRSWRGCCVTWSPTTIVS